jgi:RNA polymerase sigma-70 factor (ECF subfamily)
MATSGSDRFDSTHWSLVLAAGGEGPDSAAALEALCGQYWFPVYGYVRNRCGTADEAGDLTQAFFAEFLERKSVAVADPTRGRFRAFLLTAIKHFLANEHTRQTALKRGGGRRLLSWDQAAAEDRWRFEPSDPATPERDFDRRWAVSLLETVLHRLEREQASSGRDRTFAVLRPFLTGSANGKSQVAAAAELGISPEAARTAVHRLRSRYRELLREEIARTVGSEAEIEDELRALFAALGS